MKLIQLNSGEGNGVPYAEKVNEERHTYYCHHTLLCHHY